MSELEFGTAPVPTDAEAAPDANPHDGPACIVCGVALDYSGKGRKPKYCAEHRKSGQRTGVRASSQKNERLAAQATDALMQINGIGALACMVLGMPLTASAITTAEAGLREQVHAALITDADLCSKILSAGTHSAKISLIIAYGMFAAAVAPVGVAEAKQLRERRAAAQEERERDADTAGA